MRVLSFFGHSFRLHLRISAAPVVNTLFISQHIPLVRALLFNCKPCNGCPNLVPSFRLHLIMVKVSGVFCLSIMLSAT